jgi:hypothetical protein
MQIASCRFGLYPLLHPSYLFDAQVKNAWRCNSTPSYVFMVVKIRHTNSFICTSPSHMCVWWRRAARDPVFMATTQHILRTSLSSRHVSKPNAQYITNSPSLLCNRLRQPTVKRWDPTLLHCRYVTSRTETALLNSPQDSNDGHYQHTSCSTLKEEYYNASATHLSLPKCMFTWMSVSILAPRPTSELSAVSSGPPALSGVLPLTILQTGPLHTGSTSTESVLTERPFNLRENVK